MYGEIYCNTEKIVGTQIHLDLPSVGATENIILASCLGEGTTVITMPQESLKLRI